MRPLRESDQVHVVEHLLGEWGKRDSLSLGGGGSGTHGSVGSGRTTCQERILLKPSTRAA
jgi:hypothetical protein